MKTFRAIIEDHRKIGNIIVALRVAEPGKVVVKDTDGKLHTFPDSTFDQSSGKFDDPIWDARNSEEPPE